MTMRRITLLAAVVLGSCLDLTQAGILEGFNENAPSLEELGETHAAIQQKNRRNKGSRRIQQENGGHLGLYQKGSKKSKSSGGDFDDSNFGDSDGPNNLIPGVLPEDGDSVVRDIDFMLVMDTFAYDTDRVTIGTTFAFNGRCATTTENIGTASGSCVVISGDDNDQTVCDFYLQLSGSYGYGPIALSGSTTSSEAHMEITGAAGDFPNEGYALVDFDPAGYAVMYMYLMFTD